MTPTTSGQESPTRPVAEVLRKALEAFGPNGEKWRQHQERDADGRMCSYGAIDYASGRDCYTRRQATDLVRDVLGSPLLAYWNDQGARTFADVKALFEKAIAKAEAQ